MQRPPSETLDTDTQPARLWPIRWQNVAIAVWSSFLAASVTSVLCFAFLDPAGIAGVAGVPAGASRLTGYAIGFFLFWFAAATASVLTLYLVRTAHAAPPSGG